MVEKWFERELKLIDPLYFAAWNNKTKKWTIRKWRHPFLRRDWEVNSNVVMAIKHKVLDMRTLNDLKRGLWQAKRLKYLMREIDEANREHERKIEAEENEIHRAGATDIWNHAHNMSIDLGSK